MCNKKGTKVIKKSKVIVKTSIYNNPKNISKNKLVNFDPDYTEANASSYYYGGSEVLPSLLED